MHRTRPRLAIRTRMIVVGVIAVALFLVLYVVFNRTVVGQSAENGWAWTYDAFGTVGYWLRQRDLPPLAHDRATIVVGTVIAVAIAAVRKNWRTAVWVAVAVPGAVLASEGFKTVFGRPLLVDSRDDAVSYPSGHAVIVLAIAAALLIVIPTGWTRWVAPIVGVWMALATAALTVIGDHRPSEIIGAALLTIAVFTLTGAMTHLGLPDPAGPSRAHRSAESGEPWRDATPRPWVLLGVASLIVAAGVVAAWGAPPWVTAVDGMAGAVASLLIIRIAFAMRTWVAAFDE